MSNGRGWIGVDLDSTLAECHGWQGIHHVGKPIRPMVMRVKAWLAAGITVKIVTARASLEDPKEKAQAIEVVQKWCLLHLGQVLPVTCSKDFGLMELWDDRAVQVQHNKGLPVSGSRFEEPKVVVADASTGD